MSITTPKELIEDLKKLNPDEPIRAIYWTTADIVETFSEEYEDDNDPTIRKWRKRDDLPTSVIERVLEGLTEGEFWETISYNIKYDLHEWAGEVHKETAMKEKLETTELEQELWD